MSTSSTLVQNGYADPDILQHVAVKVPCGSCGQHYEVTLRQVLLSQEMLHEGCPSSSEPECPQLTYASLANETALRALERSWKGVLDQADEMGFTLTFCRPALSH